MAKTYGDLKKIKAKISSATLTNSEGKNLEECGRKYCIMSGVVIPTSDVPSSKGVYSYTLAFNEHKGENFYSKEILEEGLELNKHKFGMSVQGDRTYYWY